MADDKSYITEAREWLRHNAGLIVKVPLSLAEDALATEFSRIASEATRVERERCAALHESVNPASDSERHDGDPGAGAMGAVIEYRDLIRALSSIPPQPSEGERG